MQENMADGSGHSGFPRRAAAFMIDVLLVGILLLLFSYLLKSVFFRLGENQWYIGFTVLGIYFVSLHTHRGRGQTLGKRILGIRTVHEDGEFLTFHESLARYLLIALIFFSGGLSGHLYHFMGESIAYKIASALLSISSIILFFGVIILPALNTERRGLHDYLIKSVVIRSRNLQDIRVGKQAGLRQGFSLHKKSFITVAIISALALSLFLGVPYLVNKSFEDKIDVDDLSWLSKKIGENPDVENIGVQPMWYRGWKGGVQTVQHNLIVSGYVMHDKYADHVERDRLFHELHETILENHEDAQDYDNIIIRLRTGYDMVIAKLHYHDSQSYKVKHECNNSLQKANSRTP